MIRQFLIIRLMVKTWSLNYKSSSGLISKQVNLQKLNKQKDVWNFISWTPMQHYSYNFCIIFDRMTLNAPTV